MKQQKQNKKEWPVHLFLLMALLIVIGVSKTLVMARDSLEADRKLAIDSTAPLPNSMPQNQLSTLVYDGYLNK